VTVELLNVQTAASLVVSQRSAWAWLKRRVAAGSTLSVEVLSQVLDWSLLVLADYISSRLRPIAHVVDVILSLLESILSGLLVFEDL
jgi:hypothetical protein